MKHFAILMLAAFVSTSVSAEIEKPIERELENAELSRQATKFGFQNSEELKAYFTVDKVTVTENTGVISPYELAITGLIIANGTASTESTAKSDGSGLATPGDAGGAGDSSLGGILGSIGLDIGEVKNWVTLGLKIWEIIKNNQPVVSVKTQTVSVLPKSQPNWHEMETWKGPQAKSYTIAAKNLYGVTVVSHTYTVAIHYGGSIDGRGKFLANATILPTQVDVAWGFTLNSNVVVGEPLNSGTVKDPIPGVGLGLDWAMSSILKKIQGRDQFYVRGDGTTAHVNEF